MPSPMSGLMRIIIPADGDRDDAAKLVLWETNETDHANYRSSVLLSKKTSPRCFSVPNRIDYQRTTSIRID